MDIGIYTFAETTPDPETGKTIDTAQRLRDLMEEIELADQLGLDVFGIGEHHRRDFSASAPPIILAAAAERTRTIKLSTAVTVLSSDDPVRVYQQFATLDLLSGGRAEIMVGRGSFIESFPLSRLCELPSLSIRLKPSCLALRRRDWHLRHCNVAMRHLSLASAILFMHRTGQFALAPADHDTTHNAPEDGGRW